MFLCFSFMTLTVFWRYLYACLLHYVPHVFWFSIAEGLLAWNNHLNCSQFCGLGIQDTSWKACLCSTMVEASAEVVPLAGGWLGCLNWDHVSGASVFALNRDPHFSQGLSPLMLWIPHSLMPGFQVASFLAENVGTADVLRPSFQSYTVTSTLFCWSRKVTRTDRGAIDYLLMPE